MHVPANIICESSLVKHCGGGGGGLGSQSSQGTSYIWDYCDKPRGARLRRWLAEPEQSLFTADRLQGKASFSGLHTEASSIPPRLYRRILPGVAFPASMAAPADKTVLPPITWLPCRPHITRHRYSFLALRTALYHEWTGNSWHPRHTAMWFGLAQGYLCAALTAIYYSAEWGVRWWALVSCLVIATLWIGSGPREHQ